MTNAVSPEHVGAWKPKAETGVSPLAVALPELPPLAGVRLGATAAGIRYQGRTDLVLIEDVYKRQRVGRAMMERASHHWDFA